MSNQESLAEQHREVLDLSRAVNLLMVAANPSNTLVLGDT
jgi:hypothetical protein